MCLETPRFVRISDKSSILFENRTVIVCNKWNAPTYQFFRVRDRQDWDDAQPLVSSHLLSRERDLRLDRHALRKFDRFATKTITTCVHTTVRLIRSHSCLCDQGSVGCVQKACWLRQFWRCWKNHGIYSSIVGSGKGPYNFRTIKRQIRAVHKWRHASRGKGLTLLWHCKKA